ncbi:MAG: apolipoprotein N-acyltransferase [Burkholderiales bacterium]
MGAISVLGFAPFYLYFIPPIALAVLIGLWAKSLKPTAAFVRGFMFGLGTFGAGVSWVYVSLHDFGAMPVALAIIASALLCAFLALFPALVGLLQSRLAPRSPVISALSMPALWVLAEWLRGWIFTGFPWLAVGYAQAPHGPLAGFAPLLGVYGVSLATLLAATALYQIYSRWGSRGNAPISTRVKIAWPWLAVLIGLHAFGMLLKTTPWTQPAGDPISVALLQGSVPQEIKWREDRVLSALQVYRQLALASSGQLIVLPETALPLFYESVPQDYLATLQIHARAQNGDMLIGIPERVVQGSGYAYYNSVVSLGSAGIQIYRKSHLVPFGEYIPLKPLFGWIIRVLHIPLSDFSRGGVDQQPMRVAGQRVAVNICYEDVFGEEIIRQLPVATLLVNVSNDAWFGNSIAPRQHLQIAQMRALETGRYMLRATNTGITAIIDQYGNVVRQAPEFVTTVLKGNAQGFSGATPYVRVGNAVVLGLALALLAAALVHTRINRPRTGLNALLS